jgi:hypothetical protein
MVEQNPLAASVTERRSAVGVAGDALMELQFQQAL